MLKNKLNKAIELYGMAGVHPAADIPPFMSDEEYFELVEDVRDKGFLHPVRVTSEGLLIDGRNRLCASIDAGVDASIEVFDPSDPVGYVLSENKRRNLSVGQKAAMGLAAKEYYAAEAKKKQGGWHGNQYEKVAKVENFPPLPNDKEAQEKSRDKAGKAVGISGKSIDAVEKVKAVSEEIFNDVKSGKKSLNAAVIEAKQISQINPPDPPKETGSKFNVTNDSIEWAKYTWNPVTGCKTDCPYCYAKDIAMRFTGHFEPTFHPERLSAPQNTKPKANEPNNVFVCSMSDLFGVWVPAKWIDQVFEACRNNQQWNFLFLTKNPSRYIEFIDIIPPNACLGATADTQKRADAACNAFTKIGQKIENIKFLSCEPLLEMIYLSEPIDWIIVGAQSKTTAQSEFQPKWKWIENIILFAAQNKIPYYFKPNLTAKPKELPI